jgi:hypothetical protein
MSGVEIEGEAVEVTAVAVRESAGIAATGALALAALSDDDFNRRLEALEKGQRRVERIQKALMVKDIDYGIIPGTDKPTLYKPGAEMLCHAYSLAANFAVTRTIGDGITAPSLSYAARCDLHLGSLDGPIVQSGNGAANSWEKRYRWRRGERLCPNCGKPSVIKGKEEYGGGWLCWKKKDGCGSTWKDGDAAIEGQSTADVENPDPFDLDVVLVKMAEKRAHVDATLRATNASRLFTQDMEDRPDTPEAPTGPGKAQDGRTGTAEVGKGAADFELRQTPDGPALAFRLVSGGSGIKVEARGSLADALADARDRIAGATVTVWGAEVTESFTKDKGKPTEKLISFQVLRLERIEGPDGLSLPAPEAVQPGAPDDEAELDLALDKAGA